MAQLDGRATCDQEVAGSTRTGSATFFHGDIFYGHSLPSADSRRAVVSFRQKNVHYTSQLLGGLSLPSKRGWSGGAKVLCILHHRGVQLILAYSWARPAILVVGKGRGGMFLFLLFLHFHSCSSFFPVPLFHLLYSLFYLFSPFLWETTQNDPQGLTCR